LGYKTKYVFFYFFFFVFCCLYNLKAQNNTAHKNIEILKKYDANNGYKVFKTTSLEFDNLDWLWVSGSNLDLVNEEIDRRSAIIQRFDGNRFYTVKLPIFTEGKPIDISLEKRQDGKFYVIFYWKNTLALYILNPETLDFKEVKLPYLPVNNDINLFSYKDYFLAFIYKKDVIEIFKLTDNLEFSPFNTKAVIKYNRKTSPYLSNFIELENHFIISDFRSGIYVFKENGDFIKKVTFSDLGIKNKILTIDCWFTRDNKIFVLFNEIKEVYQYHPKTKEWTVEENSIIKKRSNFDSSWIYVDEKENLIEQIANENGSVFNFKNKDDNIERTIFIKNKDVFKLASRNLTKELFATNNGIFYHYSLEKPTVSTFLENESIRNMLQLSAEEILVSTASRGWYTINLNTKKAEKFSIIYKNQEKIALQGRAFFEDANYYWSSSEKGIVWVEKKTKIINEEIYFPPATLIEDEDFIYYGTYKFKLLKFDKKTKKSSIVTDTENFDIQGILKIENRFYLACAEGLVVYDNNQMKLYKPYIQGNDNFLLSIKKHPKLGILLGTHSGKLYQFNPDNNSFTLLYEDKLNASIATILFDDNNNIWLNTFNGIVSLNEKNQMISRFTMNDGLSFYEANRYSALKTKDGNFLVGTLQGLNYFDPKDISKKVIEASLKFSFTSYYDKKINNVVEVRSPQKLGELKSISIPPESKNLQFQFSLFGIYDSERIKYRYRLKDNSWIDLENKSELRLLNLSAGNYNLEIEAIDSVNNRIGNAIQLSIFVDAFFYKTIWFYLLLFIGVSGILIWYFLEEQNKYKLKEQFATKIINTQENERSRVAKELHDSIGQRLLILKNTVLQKEILDNQELKMINETIDEVRTISHNLHPFQFEKIGLYESLKNMIDEFQKSSSVFYSHEIDDISGLLSKEKELFIFRIVQECIVNVEKHAEATACNLTVVKKEKYIQFQIKDNGKGFNISEKQNLEGIGLINLKERATYINAPFNIESKQNKGTIITLKIRS
tara:strand:+ start:701 stop:3721 length:3021 start_codon:yes stop_codon:yes gene_type:complete